MSRFASILVGLLCLALPGIALAQSRPPATLSGAVTTPLTLDAATLKSVPPVTETLSFMAGKGTETGTWTGAPLWALLQKAGLVNAPGKNTGLRHTLLVTSTDGYAVSLALGELDPDYAGKQIMLAYAGGMPPATTDSLRLIVPGDAHGGRSVKDVVSVEVK